MNKVKALFPDNVEKIIISKDDYDRLTGELTLENIELKQEIERLQFIINEALRKLRASKDHFKTQQENNAVTFTIKILEEGDKK